MKKSKFIIMNRPIILNYSFLLLSTIIIIILENNDLMSNDQILLYLHTFFVTYIYIFAMIYLLLPRSNQN